MASVSTSAAVWVLGSFLVLLATCTLITLAALYYRREKQPIKYRGSYLLLVGGIAILYAWVWYMLFLMYEVSARDSQSESQEEAEDEDEAGLSGYRRIFCGPAQWSLFIANCVVIATYMVRCLRLVRIFKQHDEAWASEEEAADAALQAHVNADDALGQRPSPAHMLAQPIMEDSHTVSGMTDVISRKRGPQVYTERYLLFLILLFVGVACLIRGIVSLSGVDVTFTGFGCRGGRPRIWAWLAIDLAEILLLLYAIVKLRAIRDDYVASYGMTTELITVCVVWIVCSVGLGVVVFLHTSHAASEWFGPGGGLSRSAYLEIEASLWAVRNISICFTSIVWPVLQSYSNSFPPLWSNCDALCSLETLLRDITCIQYFRNYLMSINRVEWILCWVEMELYRDIDPMDTDMLNLSARNIYEKYIQLGGEMEVRLSPAVVHGVTREVHVGFPSVDCFAEAQTELMQLMEAEFPTFLSSPSCEACLRELEREEMLRDVLEKSGMI